MKTFLSTILLISVSALAAEVKPPQQASVPLRAGNELRGKITAFDETSITIQTTAPSPTTVQWTDVQPRAVLALSEKLLSEKASATQWFELGKLLHTLPGGGASLSARPFARALKLDPTLRGEIDSFKANPVAPTSKPIDADTEATTNPATPAGRGAWRDLTPEENDDALNRLKQRVDRLLQKSPVKLTVYETKFFVFYSNLSQTEAQRWAAVLDRMYGRLAELFDVPKDKNIWHGKAVIMVFLAKDDFIKFETEAFRNADTKHAGWCHQSPNGDVIVTFYRSPSDQDFARILVHETTHGFLHRHRAPTHIPSWANEGLADVMKYELVPAVGLKQANDAVAKQTLAQGDALKNFFTTETIENSQYSIARTLAEFMIKQNKQSYVKLINAMKDRTPWEEALKQTYNMTPAELVDAYGRSMGVNGLKAE